MLQPQPEAVYPTISVDRLYGESVTNFDVDVEAITEYLRARGMNDEAINDLTIHFSSEEKSNKSYSDAYRTLGQYDSSDNRIEVYRPRTLFSYTAPISENGDMTLDVLGDSRTNREMSSTLIHEFEHYIDEVSSELKEEMDNHHRIFKKGTRKIIVKRAISGLAMMGGIMGVEHVADSIVTDAIETQGGNASLVGFTVTVLGIGAVIVAVRRNNKAIIKDFEEIKQDAYERSPIEIKARSAEEEYSETFMDITATVTKCATVEEVTTRLFGQGAS